jgi:hypothetical protein
MNAPDENPLLRDLLTDDEALAALRRTSLAQGLGAQRRARQFRLARRAGMAALLPALLLGALLWQRSPPAPVAPSTVATAPASAGVKTITDEELFALFPHRAMALIGRPGRQQLVLLDAPARR